MSDLLEPEAMSSRDIAHAIFVEGRTQGEDMFRLLAQLQARDPLFHFPEGDVWIATGNEEVRQILRSPAAEVGFAERNDRTQPGWRDHPARTNMGEWMGHNEGARHRHLRGSVNPFFLPAMAESAEAHLRPAIRAVVAAFKAKGGGDFLSEVGYGITARVTDYLLGIGDVDHPDFREPIEHVMKTFDFGLTADQWRAADEATAQMRAFWSEQIRRKVADPSGEDILSQLIRADIFDEHEMLLTAENVLAAGSDTTANTSTNALYALLTHPDQMELARTNHQARANIPGEMMRMVSAAPTSGRLTVRDMTINGVTVPADSVVLTILAAANRDPASFANPHKLDLLRERSSREIGFGIGAHICLGQWFARKVLEILFDELLDQCSHIAFDGPPPVPTGIGMRQMRQLKVRVT